MSAKGNPSGRKIEVINTAVDENPRIVTGTGTTATARPRALSRDNSSRTFVSARSINLNANSSNEEEENNGSNEEYENSSNGSNEEYVNSSNDENENNSGASRMAVLAALLASAAQAQKDIPVPTINKDKIEIFTPQSVSGEANILKLLTYNICWEAINGLTTSDVKYECKKDPKTKETECKRKIIEVIKNGISFGTTQPLLYDIIALQEATFYEDIIDKSVGTKEYTVIGHTSKNESIATAFRKTKFKLDSEQGILKGEFGPGKPFLILFYTNNIAVINIHPGVKDNNPPNDFNLLPLKIMKAINSQDEASKLAFRQKINNYEIILMGDFNMEPHKSIFYEKPEDSDELISLFGKDLYGIHNLKTCCDPDLGTSAATKNTTHFGAYDQILTTLEYSKLKHKVINPPKTSDHKPLIVLFNLDKPLETVSSPQITVAPTATPTANPTKRFQAIQKTPTPSVSPKIVPKPILSANIGTSDTLVTPPKTPEPEPATVSATPEPVPTKKLSKIIGSRKLAVEATAPQPQPPAAVEIPTAEPTNPKFPKPKERRILAVLVALEVKKFNPVDESVTVTDTLPYEPFDAALGRQFDFFKHLYLRQRFDEKSKGLGREELLEFGNFFKQLHLYWSDQYEKAQPPITYDENRYLIEKLLNVSFPRGAKEYNILEKIYNIFIAANKPLKAYDGKVLGFQVSASLSRALSDFRMFDSNQKINSITEQSEYGVGELTFIGRATPKTLDQTTVLITNYDINDGIMATTKQKFYNSNTFKNAMDESGTPTIKASIYIKVDPTAGFRFNIIKGSKLLDMISLKRLFQEGKVLDMAPQLMYLINETAATAGPKPKHLDMWDDAFGGNMIINPIDGLDSRKQKAFAMTFYALIYDIAHKTNPENPSIIYGFDQDAKKDAININIQTSMANDGFLPHIVLLQKWASGMEMAPEEFSAILNEQESISIEGSTGIEEQLHLDVIRHGFSCRNLSKAVKNSSIFARVKNAQRVREEGADPLLSNAGLRQALELRRTVSSRPPIKYVFTSYLRRTMETAIIAYAPKEVVLRLFPEIDNDTFRDFLIELPSYPEKIIPMPFISEKKAGFGLNIDNYGIGFTKLRAWIADRLPEYLSGGLGGQIFDLGQLQSLDPDMKTNFNFTKFVQTIYPLMATSKDSYYSLVAHADVMRTLYKTIKNASIYPLEGEKRPYNTELWPLDITISVAGGKVATIKEINYSGPPITPAANLVIKPATLEMESAQKLGARCGWVQKAATKKTSKGGKRSSTRTRKVRS